MTQTAKKIRNARAAANTVEGLLVVHKPQGMTSHDVVRRVRRTFNMRRVGHAGTLDPMATGVLVVLLGRATKLFAEFEAFDKAYRATLVLGTRTDTADSAGKTVEERPVPALTREQVEAAMRAFEGETEQVPPMVSAVKFKGKRLYELARRGIEVERKPRRIRITRLELEEFAPPGIRFRLECSKGTYVRQLAEDLAGRLGTVGCITQIERVRVGPFALSDAVTLADITEEHVRPWPA